MSLSASTRSADQGRAAIHQVSGAIAAKTGLTGQRRRSETSFSLTRDPSDTSGIRAAAGELQDNVIKIRIEVAYLPAGTRPEAEELLVRVAQLDRTKIRVDSNATGQRALLGEMVVGASPLNLARQSAFEREIDRLQDLANLIQSTSSGSQQNAARDEKYASVSSFLTRVRGIQVPPGSGFCTFIEEVVDFLEAGMAVAAHSGAGLELQYATAAVAAEVERRGYSLARFTPGFMNLKTLPSIAARAPGWLTVSALQLASGSDNYQVAEDAAVAFAQLRRQNSPLFITGTFEELQCVFARGQGLRANPLEPLVRTIPGVEIEWLVKFAVSTCADATGGLTLAAEADVTKAVMAAVAGLPRNDALQVLQPVAGHALSRWKRRSLGGGVQGLAKGLAAERSTLAGFSARRERERCEELQRRLNAIAQAADPANFLRADLFGQDTALDEMGARLRTEVLTRPPHQPIRWMAQGPPGTGKSESLKLLARLLGLHHEFIDASGYSDVYTAAAQLLGAGRGLVGSNRPGRLEQAAQQRPGVIVEVADLDHAPPAVRMSVADLFLKAMEEGEADSATGTPFILSNLILVFTVNVDQEQRLRQGMGFGSSLSREEITRRTIQKLVTEFSPAFIDRVGAPIVFEPLDHAALVAIAQREAVSDFRRAADCLRLAVGEVHAAADLGEVLVRGYSQLTSNPGARGLKEHVRQQVAEAVALWRPGGGPPAPLYLTTNELGKILIKN